MDIYNIYTIIALIDRKYGVCSLEIYPDASCGITNTAGQTLAVFDSLKELVESLGDKS